MKILQSAAIGLLICSAVVVFALALLLFPSRTLVKGGTSYVFAFEESITGLDVGAPVRLLGVSVGHVRHIAVDWDPEQQKVRSMVTITLAPPDGGRRKSGMVAELLRPPQVHHLVGTLQMESLVTGKLFVNLNYDAAVLGKGEQLVSRASSLKSLGEQLTRISEGMGRIDFDGIGQSLELALRRMEELCGQLQDEMTPAMTEVVKVCHEFRATAETLRSLVNRGSPLPHELGKFLQDVGLAARSVRNFFDFLEQNPNALLTGKWGEGTR